MVDNFSLLDSDASHIGLAIMKRNRGRQVRAGVVVTLILFATFFTFVMRLPTAEAQPHPYTIDFSTYFGGSLFEQARDAVTDKCGNIFITGGTQSTNFPTTPGANDTTHNGWMDVFVTKIDRRGRLVWSTFLGGPNYDRAYAIELDDQGYVYVGGRAGDGFPTTSGVLQTTFAGDTNPGAYGTQDGFIAKLKPDGSQVVWATYFGGPGSDFERDIDVDSFGDVYLAVAGVNQDHPHITPGAFDPVRNGSDAMIAKITNDATSVVYASYVGGSTNDGGGPTIRVDKSRNAYILLASTADDAPVSPSAYQPARGGASDMVLVKVNATGSFLWGTYFGGPGNEGTETHHLALDPDENPVMAAYTSSNNLPTNATAIQPAYGGNGDGFIARISADGTSLLGATYLGGSQGDGPEGITIDSVGDIYLSGATNSGNFPTTVNAYQPSSGGATDMFGVKVSLNLTELHYATYVGGSIDDSARSSTIWQNRSFILVGQTNSITDFPLVNPNQSAYGGGNGDNVFVAFSLWNAPPIADAGPDQIVPKSTLVTLDATGCSDPEGDCLSYAWSQTAGPPVTLSGATTSRPTFTPTVPGFYTFNLVIDDGADNATDSVNVTVTGMPPNATLAVNPANVLVGQQAEVTANGSFDPDGTIVSYNFTFGDGTSSGDIAVSWTSHAWSSPGTFIVNVTVTDDDNFTDNATTTVNVTSSVNLPPVASIVATPTIGNLSTVFQFDGSGSTDPDGVIVNWTWDLGDGNITYGSIVSHQYSTRGIFFVNLTVMDDNFTSNTTSETVNVLNRPPVANAGSDATGAKYISCMLNGSASSDPDSDTLTFWWVQTSGPTTNLIGADTATPSFTPTLSGVYIFRLTVDDGFLDTDSDIVQVTVSNFPPVADAGTDATSSKYVLVMLNGSGSTDPDGETITFSWTQIGGPSTSVMNASTAKPSFTPVRSGLYTFRLTVNDVEGDNSTDDVTITVTNSPPTADAGSDMNVTAGQTVTLDGGGSSDPDGDQLTFAWTQIGGPTVTLTGDNTSTPSFTPSTPGNYTFQLIVDDGDGGNTTDIVVISVEAAPVIDGGDEGVYAWWFFIAVVIVVVILLLLFMIWRRRKQQDETKEGEVIEPPREDEQ